MNFVDKQNYFTVFRYEIYRVFQPLLKIAAIFRACKQSRQIKRKHRLSLQQRRDVSVYYRFGKSVHNRRLANARLPNQHRIVFGAAGQNLNYPFYFLLPADDRVKFVFPRFFCYVRAELGKLAQIAIFFLLGLFLLGRFETCSVRNKLHEIGVLRGFYQQLFHVYAKVLQNTYRIVIGQKNSKQYMLCTDIIAVRLPSKSFRLVEHQDCRRRKIE